MLTTKPIILSQTAIKAETFSGTILNGLVEVREATNIVITTQSITRY